MILSQPKKGFFMPLPKTQERKNRLLKIYSIDFVNVL